MRRRSNRQRDIGFIFGQTGEGKSEMLNAILYNYNRVIIVDPFAELDAELYTDDPARVYRHCKGSPFYRVVFSDVSRVNELCAVVSQLDGLTFAVDEVQTVYQWKTRNVEPGASDIIFSGRHSGISVWLTTQRPLMIPISFRSQQKRVIAFRQTEKADLDWLKSICRDPRQVDALRFFEPRQYLDITRDSVTVARS